MNIGFIAPLLAAFLFWSESLTSVTTSEVSLRCMIQMVNYDGEGAYVIVGLVDSEGKHRQIFYEKPVVKKTDALKAELKNYVNAVLGKEVPMVDGFAGKQALDVAIKIHDKILEDLR